MLKRKATAGTEEGSDVLVTIEPGEKGIEIQLDSVVAGSFGEAIKRTILEMLEEFQIEDCKVIMRDSGALDSTIRARLETAILRACEEV